MRARQARTLLGVYYAYMTEYRAELVLWMLAGALPFIMMGVWMEAAASGAIGMEPVAFARYFLAVFVVRQLTVVWVVWDFEREVVEGRLSARLLQPLDPVWRHVAAHLSERAVRLPFTAVLIGLFFAIVPEAIWVPGARDVALAALAVGFVFAVRFLMQHTFALLAFWSERASAVEEVSFLLYFFLSGFVAPLELYPEAVRAVAEWTPYPWLIAFPVDLLLGTPVDVGRGLAVMVAWATALLAVNRWLWRRGLRHYSAMGA